MQHYPRGVEHRPKAGSNPASQTLTDVLVPLAPVGRPSGCVLPPSDSRTAATTAPRGAMCRSCCTPGWCSSRSTEGSSRLRSLISWVEGWERWGGPASDRRRCRGLLEPEDVSRGAANSATVSGSGRPRRHRHHADWAGRYAGHVSDTPDFQHQARSRCPGSRGPENQPVEQRRTAGLRLIHPGFNWGLAPGRNLLRVVSPRAQRIARRGSNQRGGERSGVDCHPPAAAESRRPRRA